MQPAEDAAPARKRKSADDKMVVDENGDNEARKRKRSADEEKLVVDETSDTESKKRRRSEDEGKMVIDESVDETNEAQSTTTQGQSDTNNGATTTADGDTPAAASKTDEEVKAPVETSEECEPQSSTPGATGVISSAEGATAAHGPATSSSSKPSSPTGSTGEPSASSPKVPPLRIVITSTATGNNANQVSSAGDANQKVSSSSGSSAASKSISYVVSSLNAGQQDKDIESGSDNEDDGSQTTNSNSSSAPSGRVTRSQRAQQAQKEEKQESSRERRARERDTDRDEAEGTATSPTSTSSKDSGKDPDQKDGLRREKRKVRSGKTGALNADRSKQQSNEQDDDNDSTSSSTSSGAGKDAPASGGRDTAATANGQQPNKEFQMPSYNSYQMYLNIRKQIDKRRKQMFAVQPKPPQGFKDYLLNKGGYLLHGKVNVFAPGNHSDGSNGKNALPQLGTPPPTLKPGHALHSLFIEQEKARQKLRIQHVIEKEKLRLSAEQEILRVHGRAALAMANQSVPFSVCSILKDDEIYNVIEPEGDGEPYGNTGSKNEYQKSTYSSGAGSSADLTTLTGTPQGTGRSRYNGRLFLSWLQDVDDKWEKIKEETIKRQRRESESLFAVQKLDWEWKMKELGLCDFRATPTIERAFVPSVEVPRDFELLPS